MGFLLKVVTGLATSVLLILVAEVLQATTVSLLKDLFGRDKVTGLGSGQLLIVLTTVLLVVRFLLDLFGPWHNNGFMMATVSIIETFNYTTVHYTMGLMQLSAARVNGYFQVWAVLLVTLQSSVKVGRPYSRSMQIPLLDIMSSFWAANLIRVQTAAILRIPIWLIWSLNAARIISYFSFSEKARAINQESIRVVGDYMRYEHKLDDGSPPHVSDPNSEFTMKWYKYLVLGEVQVLKDLREGRPIPAAAAQQVVPPAVVHPRRRKHGIRLDPQVYDNLTTVDQIWNSIDIGHTTTGPGTAGQLKDLCLSFSLYKLLRRRFFNLPIHEARLPGQVGKMRRLVFDYILHDAERAFRVTATEMSFLRDLLYSKHAAMFANGFPTVHLLISLLLVAATGYMAYPVCYIPGTMDPADRNRITHGVFTTRVMVALIVGKELAEIWIYVFSRWTMVLMLCRYAKRRRRCRSCWHALVEKKLVQALLCFTVRSNWNGKIYQHNLLIASSSGNKCWMISTNKHKLETSTMGTTFESVKRLKEEPGRLGSYFSHAFGAPDQPLHRQLRWAVELEADTHRILVWHIATCLCEINLASSDEASRDFFMQCSRPFVKKQQMPDDQVEAAVWWEHYATAACLSNYCMYLVTEALVPDSGLIVSNVYGEVGREINHVTFGSYGRFLLRRRSMRDMFTRLMATVNMADDNDDDDEEEAVPPEPRKKSRKLKRDSDRMDISNSLTRKGAMLGKQLMEAYGADRAGLWEKLAVFWTEFLLHLAASTRASMHRMHLTRTQELTTVLWALLSHAGFLRGTNQETAQDDL